MAKKIESDLTKGHLFKQLLMVAVPLILTQLLSMLFHSTDTFVLGIFVGGDAVAAVGANSSLINLIIGVFVGIATGTSVVLAKAIGEHNQDKCQKVVAMSVVLGLVIGIALMFVGIFCARYFLTLMKTDEKVIDMAVKYLQVYFAGMPVMMLYQFCSAVMRAAGDTKRPLIYLAIGGVLNLVMNIFFITVVGLDVEGVAIATVLSQGVATALCVIALLKAEGLIKLSVKKIGFYREELLDIIRIGLPSGIQSCCFNLANVLMQSAVNVFGNVAMAGSTYGGQIEGYVYYAMNGVAIGNMSVVSQNYGAKKMERVKRTLINSVLLSLTLGFALGMILYLLEPIILGWLTASDEFSTEIIEYAMLRSLIILPTYFLCGIMESFTYAARAIGKSFSSMVVSLVCVCALRIVWLEIILPIPQIYSFQNIFLCYPISWIMTIVVMFIFWKISVNKIKLQTE